MNSNIKTLREALCTKPVETQNPSWTVMRYVSLQALDKTHTEVHDVSKSLIYVFTSKPR